MLQRSGQHYFTGRPATLALLLAAALGSCGTEDATPPAPPDDSGGAAEAGSPGAPEQASEGGHAGADASSGGIPGDAPNPVSPKPSDGNTGGGGAVGGAGDLQSDAGAGGQPPLPQGAFRVRVTGAAASATVKSCPSGVAVEFAVPAVDPIRAPNEVLSAYTYVHHVADGRDGAQVSCRVAGNTSFVVTGSIALGSKSFVITDGVLGPNRQGTALLTVSDGELPGLDAPLSSAPATCSIDASSGVTGIDKVKAGAIWGHISCPVLEREPDYYCQAEADFVFENCEAQ